MAQTHEGAMKFAASRAGVGIEEFLRRVASGEKFCWRCRAWHPCAAFYSDRTRHDGLSACCRESRNRLARATYKPIGRRSRKGEHFVPTRDGDAQQARARVNHRVDVGLLPDPSTFPCVYCGAVWRQGQRPHEYHHHKGYSAEHQLDVVPVCRKCHGRQSAKALATHCIRGHEFTPENIIRGNNGTRKCRECRREYDRNRVRPPGYWKAINARRRARNG